MIDISVIISTALAERQTVVSLTLEIDIEVEKEVDYTYSGFLFSSSVELLALSPCQYFQA